MIKNSFLKHVRRTSPGHVHESHSTLLYTHTKGLSTFGGANSIQRDTQVARGVNLCRQYSNNGRVYSAQTFPIIVNIKRAMH